VWVATPGTEGYNKSMCGRFVQSSSVDSLAERFHVAEVGVDALEPDYNVTPRASVPIIRERARDDPPTRVLSLVRWGLVPSWAESPSIGDRQINARAESITERPAYQRAFRRRRCIVPADAFYEWTSKDKIAGQPRGTPRQPYLVHRRDGEPMAFAGLWEIWRDESIADRDAPGAWLRTCAIITTGANALLAPIHARMPVTLPESAWGAWLDPANTDLRALQAVLVPAPDESLEVYPVSTRVNKPENNDPSLIERESPLPL
jgi:putative SOS response-associated peptidase YedK